MTARSDWPHDVSIRAILLRYRAPRARLRLSFLLMDDGSHSSPMRDSRRSRSRAVCRSRLRMPPLLPEVHARASLPATGATTETSSPCSTQPPGLMRIPSAGGSPMPLIGLKRADDEIDTWPQVLPGSQT